MTFFLELKSLIRSKTLLLMILAVTLWMIAVPFFIRTDGTEEGARYVVSYYSLAGAIAIVAISVAAAAAASLSSERAAKRLQLTLIKPVSYLSIALGKILAITLIASIPLGLAVSISAFRNADKNCRHVYSPVMESPRQEAERMYKAYMADPSVSEQIKKARKSSVIAILTQKAYDHYMAVPEKGGAAWKFNVPKEHALKNASVRIRFSDAFSLRRDVQGRLEFGGRTAFVTNITQAVVEMPLVGKASQGEELKFINDGESQLMLRPRRDIELLFEADSSVLNHVRAWVVLVAMMALVASFGVFLGAGLSRPVAVWTILVSLFLSLASPAVVEQYPHALEIGLGDAIGLALSRAVGAITNPLTQFSPVNALANGECIEYLHMSMALAIDAVLLPFILAVFASLLMKRVKT
ncbi:MAG: hypothetical protein J6S51_03995 [Kiritimatiellae bacterium]|nr:hypothetical protein [Kiritimatiellia bacterium]